MENFKTGGFFGSNASGKTIFIKSLHFAKNFIVNGQKSGKGTGINQFRGAIDELQGKSLFQFMFYLQGDVYEYGVSLGTDQVYEEWWVIITEKGFQPLFQHLKIIFPKSKVQGLPLRMDKDDDFRKFILKNLNNMDTGVIDISVVSDVMDFRESVEKLNIPNEIVSQVEDIKNGILTFAGKYFIFGEGEKRQTLLVQIKFEHMLNGQIVFTAHDVNLINLEEFGQDEIWFVEKDRNGESHFRPFSDFEVQKGQDALKAYLNGRFGAVSLIRGEI